jgi:hypothetical protein
LTETNSFIFRNARVLWFLKTFHAQGNRLASHSKVEISDVTLGSADGPQATNKCRLSDEQQSGEEEIRIYAATA